MKKETILKAYYDASAQTSSRTREFAFGGLALVWILKGESTIPNMDKNLFSAGLFLIFSLATDLIQYLYKTALWGGINAWQECKRGSADYNITVYRWVNTITFGLFLTKIILMSIAYYHLGKFIL